MLDKTAIAEAYLAFMGGDHSRLLALVGDDFFDNVSGQSGPGIWRTVAEWLVASFSEVEVELHSVAEDEDGRVFVWITFHGTHIGSAFPFMAGRSPSGQRISWPQVHVFRSAGDRLVEHWAIRNDLHVLDGIAQGI